MRHFHRLGGLDDLAQLSEAPCPSPKVATAEEWQMIQQAEEQQLQQEIEYLRQLMEGQDDQ